MGHHIHVRSRWCHRFFGVAPLPNEKHGTRFGTLDVLVKTFKCATCWRALAKGTAWAGFYCEILLLRSSAPQSGCTPPMTSPSNLPSQHSAPTPGPTSDPTTAAALSYSERLALAAVAAGSVGAMGSVVLPASGRCGSTSVIRASRPAAVMWRPRKKSGFS